MKKTCWYILTSVAALAFAPLGLLMLYMGEKMFGAGD